MRTTTDYVGGAEKALALNQTKNSLWCPLNGPAITRDSLSVNFKTAANIPRVNTIRRLIYPRDGGKLRAYYWGDYKQSEIRWIRGAYIARHGGTINLARYMERPCLALQKEKA